MNVVYSDGGDDVAMVLCDELGNSEDEFHFDIRMTRSERTTEAMAA